MADLRSVYAAVDEPAALDALDAFSTKWDTKYPKISRSWRENWANLSTYFKYPQEVRRLIYTTNAIEGFNRQLRKVTKARSVFPTDDSLFKMLYLAMVEHHEEMDRTAAGLERALRTAVDLLRRAHARITPSYPDVKGKGCKQPGFAALDIWFRRRYGREKAASVRPLPPHTSFCCLHPRRTFTQNSGWTPENLPCGRQLKRSSFHRWSHPLGFLPPQKSS